MDRTHIIAIIEFLERVKQRPWSYIGLDAAYIIPFLDGVNLTCTALGLERDKRFYEEAVEQRGWIYTNWKATFQMQEQGWSDEEMVVECIEIEIDAWKRVLERYTPLG